MPIHLPRRPAILVLALLVAAAACLAAYTVVDDARVATRQVTLIHPQLPAAFDGYRMLQITDLHSAEFGPRQERLIAAIRAQRVDCILLTGDYTDISMPTDEAPFGPLRDLLARLPRGVPAYYLLGNWEDESEPYGSCPGTWSPAVRVLERAGVRPLYPAVTVRRGAATLWLTGWNTEGMPASFRPGLDFNVAVTHRPIDIPDMDSLLAAQARGETQRRAWLDWKINIAGHTHGGQWRLPVIGGVISPMGQGLFPGDRLLYGVRVDKTGRVGYICGGLGAGGPFPPLRFRLFNTPEIAVITLKRGPSGGTVR